MVNILLSIAMIFISLGILFTAWRLIKGPTPADRVVALDGLTIISMSVIALIALFAGRVIFVDVAMVYAMLSFVGVIAVARYIEGGL
ncbi:MAG: cation:proton antiporter [Chlorobi bacterium]|nr:cation:proton antiporter [Chlorobiota bacterium]